MQQKHSPLLWEAHFNDLRTAWITDKDGSVIVYSHDITEDDVKSSHVDLPFIVQVCNNFEELLGVCKAVRHEIETAWAYGDLVHIPHDNPQMTQYAKWSDKLQAAIAKAEKVNP